MELINSILLAIFLALLIGFVIYLFFVLRNLLSSIKTIENESLKISKDLRSLIVSTEELTKKISGITTQIDDQVKSLEWVVNVIKKTATDFITMKDRVISIIEEPIDGLNKNFNAVKKGFSAFWNKLLNK